jgi:hypothetical protein
MWCCRCLNLVLSSVGRIGQDSLETFVVKSQTVLLTVELEHSPLYEVVAFPSKVDELSVSSLFRHRLKPKHQICIVF